MTTTIEHRIEQAFNDLMDDREVMEEALQGMKEKEENAKVELGEDWEKAKNNDVRYIMVLTHLADDDEYQELRKRYRDYRFGVRMCQLRIEKLKLLVAAGMRFDQTSSLDSQ